MPRVKKDSICIILHEVKNGMRRYICSYTVYETTEERVRKLIETALKSEVKA